jgi:hypothetical protein
MREALMMKILCLVMVVGSLAVAAWALITGQVGEQGIDGLFLIFICLIVAGAFGAVLRGLVARKKTPAERKEDTAEREAS